MSNSREHHWWPVALQEYWSTLGEVKSLSPDGKTGARKYYNRKIAKKSHGHTIILDPEFWRDNFESEFDAADDSIHRVAMGCIRLFSLSKFARFIWRAARSRMKRRTGIEDFSESLSIDPVFRRELINLCISLLIRSPANRYKLERTGASFGLPPNEEVGKMNMKIQVDGMLRHYSDGFRGNIFSMIIYSQVKEFVYGDGLLDGISSSLGSAFLQGHALIPLTPHICILLATPHSIRNNQNARILFAPPWLVDHINSITQVYSKSQLFYASKAPKISDDFKKNEHQSYKGHTTEIVRSLLNICGEREVQRIFF